MNHTSDTFVDQDNLFDVLSIEIASDDVIRNQWSYGEIKKPETINYRTLRAEKGGLFCEKTFGPTVDWECACGKYKKIKNKGIVCDRCGVEVTHSKVRRERMAHIELAVPVVHIWFFKTMPSRIGNLLGITNSELERVVYYEEHIVIDPGQTELKAKQLLNERELMEARERWGRDAFVAEIGGEAIRALLKKEDLNTIVLELKEKLKKTRSMQARMKLAKRLKIVEGFLASPNKSENMVMNVIPVIPPDLRPLVPLDGGRFATSDLNDLYRRVINRNNRLKALRKRETPKVILWNEMRMLQEAVDSLIDNGRHGHPVMGAGNRPLKSLAEMLKGKSGRFRQNLLGKRVDYSGRSVIVVGPELRMHECGLPKEMALELFEPFIVQKLKARDLVYTIRSAKKMIQARDPVVWDILEEVIEKRTVLLNRAPTLHRLGIQGFQPRLIEGKAIRVHPLVCAAFNADFDGDQMAVHIPLSVEAQIEARSLLMAPDNIFSPSSGKPISTPSKDMTLGLYYLMQDPLYLPEEHGEEVMIFSSPQEAMLAISSNMQHRAYGSITGENQRIDNLGRGLHIHEHIKVRIKGKSIIDTTPGRVIFNTIVPPALGFQNYVMNAKRCSQLIMECYKKLGKESAVRLLDDLKAMGFQEATRSSVSLAVSDIALPPSKKALIGEAEERCKMIDREYQEGIITEGERKSKVVALWTEVTETLSTEVYEQIREVKDMRHNPLFTFIDSGARGNRSHLKQLAAMRGLMAKSSGDIISDPVKESFCDGLSPGSFFISSYGARKGLTDMALKTADSGYLTRRLVDVAHDILVVQQDCGTMNGIEVSAIKQGQTELMPLAQRIEGRAVCENIYMPGDTSQCLAKAGTILTSQQAQAIDDAGIETVRIRSPLTCESKQGVCSQCYGINPANSRRVELGEAVGIIAAQSIGEPGTQLTMRTFHSGGIAAGSVVPELISAHDGIVIYQGVRSVATSSGYDLALNKNGFLHVLPDQGRTLDEYKKLLEEKTIEPVQTFPIELGAILHVRDGQKVKKGLKLVELEIHSIPVICEKPGYARYEDLIEGISTQKNLNKKTGKSELVVRQHRGELHPQIMLYADKEMKQHIGSYAIPAGAILSVAEGEAVEAGQILARLPRGAVKTKDITGGLHRVAELFEARRPRDSAVIAKLDGVVEIKGVQKNRRIIVIFNESTNMREEHQIPLSKHLIVQHGDPVNRGQQLTDGLTDPHEILEHCGVRELQSYLVDQVQEVYRLQGVDICDKHVEIIVKQMLQKVRIVETGDTTHLFGEEVTKEEFTKQNTKAQEEGGQPAKATTMLEGITSATVKNRRSYISAAAFQDTVRVLTDAATQGQKAYRDSFKHCVLTGTLVPSGTGFHHHQRVMQHLDKNAKVLEFDFVSELT